MTESKWEERKKKKRESPLRRKGRRMSRLCRLRAVGGGGLDVHGISRPVPPPTVEERNGKRGGQRPEVSHGSTAGKKFKKKKKVHKKASKKASKKSKQEGERNAQLAEQHIVIVE